MKIIDKVHQAIRKHVEQCYWEPHFIIMNQYTLNKLREQIREDNYISLTNEVINKSEVFGIPILIRHGDFSKEIYVETILDYKKTL